MKKLQFIKKAVSGILCVGILFESGTENLVYAAVINGEESVSVENSDSTTDRKSTRLNSSHNRESRMPSSA